MRNLSIPLSSNDKQHEITMEDVQTAIAILTHFLRKEAEVRQVLARMNSLTKQNSGGGGPLDMNNVVRMVMDEAERRKGVNTVAVNDGIMPPEDTAKMKELTERFRKKTPDSSASNV